ncbi:MAG TPA: hypothetical protein VFS26_01835 [Solirubrobacterales bacterium]|nr:hypothetical protein [Solirubrobacterales bacterium]
MTDIVLQGGACLLEAVEGADRRPDARDLEDPCGLRPRSRQGQPTVPLSPMFDDQRDPAGVDELAIGEIEEDRAVLHRQQRQFEIAKGSPIELAPQRDSLNAIDESCFNPEQRHDTSLGTRDVEKGCDGISNQ